MTDLLPDWLTNLPAAEDERHEYKGGATPDRELGEKLGRGASAFWNSGGGRFVIGVDDSGVPDAGITLRVGRQSRRDWVDQVVARVAPTAGYQVEVREGSSADDRGVVAVSFRESASGPHMAPDGRYYVRGGAHTVQATHFVVEAIRAQRALTRPHLRARLRRNADRPALIELIVLALTDAPAIDVEIDLVNPERLFAAHPTLREPFLLRLGVVDRAHPHVMDYDMLPYLDEPRVGDAAPRLEVTYRDVVGNRYTDSFPLEVIKSVSSMTIGHPPIERVANAVEQMTKQLDVLVRSLGNLTNRCS